MCVTFCDDRLRGFGVARGRHSGFFVDLRRRPYNILALPCECVIRKSGTGHSNKRSQNRHGDSRSIIAVIYPYPYIRLIIQLTHHNTSTKIKQMIKKKND